MDTVFDQLDREWLALIRRPSSAAALADACDLAGVASLLELVPAMRRADPPMADAVLAHLARQAHGGSEVAARAVLQILVPGTCRLAAKWWALGSSEDRAAAAVAAVFGRIRRYPIDRRPSRIAANILMDANQDLARAARCLVAEYDTVIPLEPELFIDRAEEPWITPAEELREVITDAIAAGRVPRDWAALIVATLIEGIDLPTIARRTGTPVRTLQWRRRHAEAALVAGAAA
jgi:hypothetical protein